MSFDVARLHCGQILVFVCLPRAAGEMPPRTRRETDGNWLTANAGQLAQTIADGFERLNTMRTQSGHAADYMWFETDVSGRTPTNRYQWIRNSIVTGGLAVYRDDPTPTGDRMDPLSGTVNGQAFALSQDQTLDNHIRHDNPQWLAANANAIATFVATNFGNRQSWYRVDITRMNAAQRVTFIENAIWAGMLSVHIPDP